MEWEAGSGRQQAGCGVLAVLMKRNGFVEAQVEGEEAGAGRRNAGSAL